MKDKKQPKIYPFTWKGKINKYNRKNFTNTTTDEKGLLKLCKQ